MRPLLLTLLLLSAAAAQDPLELVLQRAGNSADDSARLAAVEALSRRADLPAAVRADAQRLASFLQAWVRGSNLTFYTRLPSRPRDYAFDLSANSPLEPLTWLYRGRMILWDALESGSVWSSTTQRQSAYDRARPWLERYAAAYPQNPITPLYLGPPQPWPTTRPDDPQAPAWANAQRRAVEGLADVVHWWITQRQQPDGSYGGGWGDDCEMWRWWVPVLIAFDDPLITAAQAKFSAAMMAQPHMAGGFTKTVYDVEHVAEDSADVITPMMHLAPDDPQWRRRAERLTQLMRDLWTGRNQRGQLQFKSTYFSVDRVDERPERACDTPYHCRTVQPALLLWQRTADPVLGEVLGTWLDTWVEATAREERGKPAGIIPAAIHWPDGAIGGTSPDWWDPRNHSETTLYLWPSAMSMLTDALLLAWQVTGQERYLQPLRSMAQIQQTAPRPEQSAPGSAAWCAARMGFLRNTLAKYRLLTGRTEFDPLLRSKLPSYVGFRLDGDRGPLERDLATCAAAFSLNFGGYTSEVRYTDRCLRFPQLFSGPVRLPTATAPPEPNPTLLWSTLTGDPGDAGYFPLNAVRWLTPPRDFAALVTSSGPNTFAAEVYHFGDQPRSLSAELYLLRPGTYHLRLESPGTAPTTTAVTVAGPRTRVTLHLPPRQVVQVRVEP